MTSLLGPVTPVLMAKMPAIGAVKTRLTVPGACGRAMGARAAVEVAWAMLACTAARLGRGGRLVLAVTPDGSGTEVARRLEAGTRPRIIDQGPGDLGRRIDRVWRTLGTQRPVAFFGADSPDIPDAVLAEIPAALLSADLAIGPTHDGGYWTLAAASHHPAVLDQIDWGSSNVYDQTCRRAAEAGLMVHQLPAWRDVDIQEDVDALRTRLKDSGIKSGPLHGLLAVLDALP